MNTSKILLENDKILVFIKSYQAKNDYNPKFLNEYNHKFNSEFNYFLNNNDFSKETINLFTN